MPGGVNAYASADICGSVNFWMCLERGVGAVTEAEILAASAAGRVLDCWDGGVRRVVDAALLRRCCHEKKDQVDPRGISLRGGAIAGSLDLTGLDVRFPLRLEDCEFGRSASKPPGLRRASAHAHPWQRGPTR